MAIADGELEGINARAAGCIVIFARICTTYGIGVAIAVVVPSVGIASHFSVNIVSCGVDSQVESINARAVVGIRIVEGSCAVVSVVPCTVPLCTVASH